MKKLFQQTLDIIRSAWRFRWAGLAVSWAVCLLMWPLIILAPNSFTATARIFVDARTTLSEVTRGIGVETSVESQLMRVRQALLGGPELERVARQTGLVRPEMTPAQVRSTVDELRNNIDISGALTGNQGFAGIYSVAYINEKRQMAIKVVDRLLNDLVHDTLQGKREGSEQAQKFLQDQIKDYETRLAGAEERLAAFKKQNVGLMPGQQGDYFTNMQTEQLALAKAQSQFDVATRRRDELQRQLRGSEPLITSPTATAGGGVQVQGLPNAPVGANNDTATRIRETQARLDDMLLRFTEKHPDVIALRGTLAELQQRQADEISAARRGDPGAAARTGLAANPVYQSIQLEYNKVEVELAAMRADIADRERNIARLKGLANTVPEVEAEYSRLNRDYDVTRAQHKALVERLERTRVSEGAEATGIVRFEIIEPPAAGFVPNSPKRPAMIILVFMFSLGAGAGVAYGLSLLKPVFLNARQLVAATGLPVLGIVSVTGLDRFRSHERLRAWALAAGVFALFVATLVMVALQGRAVEFIHGPII